MSNSFVKHKNLSKDSLVPSNKPSRKVIQDIVGEKNDEEENDLGDIFFSQQVESDVNVPQVKNNMSMITIGRLQSVDEHELGPNERISVA